MDNVISLVDLSLQEARKRISNQTGFLHYYEKMPEDKKADTIALLSNFLYVHALFRSKLVENVQEGRQLLERLLSFEVHGNFPVYLHEYPQCKKPFMSADLLPVLFYLQKEYAVGLGVTLLQKIEDVSRRIVSYLRTLRAMPDGARSYLQAFCGEFLSSSYLPHDLQGWGQWCIAAQMAKQPLDDAIAYFDEHRGVFLRPVQERRQAGYEPVVTIMDLFMGQHFSRFFKRSLQSHSAHLQASLVYPMPQPRDRSQQDMGYTVILGEFHRALLLYFGDVFCTHSITVEGHRGSWSTRQEQHRIHLQYRLCKDLPMEDDAIECALYIDAHPDIRLFIEGQKATVFFVHDCIEIHSPTMRMYVRFAGNGGRWMGHILRGNRLSQERKGDGAFDWKIAWRTIEREEDAQVEITVDLKPVLGDSHPLI